MRGDKRYVSWEFFTFIDYTCCILSNVNRPIHLARKSMRLVVLAAAVMDLKAPDQMSVGPHDRDTIGAVTKSQA